MINIFNEVINYFAKNIQNNLNFVFDEVIFEEVSSSILTSYNKYKFHHL